MKHVSRSILVACAIVGSLLSGGARAQAADEFGRRSGHPYLTYSDANIEKLKERIANEPMIAETWERMLEDANRVMSGNRRGSTELICLAYRMTGDKRFGEKAKASLFKHQFGGRSASMLMKRNPPWRAGLDAGDRCHSFAIVYDTVYDLLTPKERKELASRCAEEGILPVLNDWVLVRRAYPHAGHHGAQLVECHRLWCRHRLHRHHG